MLNPNPSRSGDRSQEKSEKIFDITKHGDFILADTVKESVAELVTRWRRETGYSPAEASERAKKRGHKVSAGYIDDLMNARADNPSPRLQKAVAAAFGKPVEEIEDVAMGRRLKEDADYLESVFAECYDVYRRLSSAKQKEKRWLVEMLIREIQREL